MTFKELLEHFGFDVNELLDTEVGQHKSGQTFLVNAQQISNNGEEGARLELFVTALKFEAVSEKK